MLSPTCTMTVSQAEICTRALSTCDEADDLDAAEECAALMTCLP